MAIKGRINHPGPACEHMTIVPQDNTPITPTLRAIYVGLGGDISITDIDGVTCIYRNVPGGGTLPFGAWSVNATGTTAQFLVGLY